MADSGIIQFAVYEGGTDYLGIARVQLPNYNYKTHTVNGVGIAGDVTVPVLGHMDAMTCTIEFLDSPTSARVLNEMRRHIIDIRCAHEAYNPTTGEHEVHAYKHILEIAPLQMTQGNLAPHSQQATQNQYTVYKSEDYIDGALVQKYDPLNYVHIDNSGTDRLADVRTALGK